MVWQNDNLWCMGKASAKKETGSKLQNKWFQLDLVWLNWGKNVENNSAPFRWQVLVFPCI